ncbi:MAG: AbrB/MazE/SpoVT family DNA-binding domain-containing protein [bacterium]|nr:AbrB/MazE/SpoVT family DNA-binding domain-containing protein [bacterium]
MQTVTLSSQYRIAIPKPIRERHNLKPGEKFILMSIGDRIEMVPEKNMEDLQGVLAGMDADPEREKVDRV